MNYQASQKKNSLQIFFLLPIFIQIAQSQSMISFFNQQIKIQNMSLAVTFGSLSSSDRHHDNSSMTSLRWDWQSSSIFTIKSPPMDQTKVLDFYFHTTTIWIYNQKYSESKLSFEYLDNLQNVNFRFDFNLNYEGWRQITRSYLYDMNKTKNASNKIVKINVKAPNIGSGSLYFGLWNFVQPRKQRVASLQMPSISGYLSEQTYLAFYNFKQDIEAINSTIQLNNNILSIKEQVAKQLNVYPVKKTDITSAIKFYLDQNVTINGNQIISKQHLTPAGIQTHLYALVMDFLTNNKSSSLEMAKNLIWIVDDAGYAGGSELVFGWYDTKKYFSAVLLIFPYLDQSMKAKIKFTLKWNLKIGQFWDPNPVPGWNSDYVNNILLYTLGYIVICNNDTSQTLKQLTGFKRFLERKNIPSTLQQGWIKIDGTSFHHMAHYNAYMYSFNVYASILFILNGTKFQIKKDSYNTFRDAAYNLLIMSNTVQFANSLCGRHPFTTYIPMKKQYYRILAYVGGPILGQQFDSKIVGAYNRIWNDELLFKKYPAQPFPTGFWQFNYSPIGIYRMNGWVATIRGINSVFWGAQIYKNENRFGRYQSYGSVQIIYHGGLLKSGFSKDGYDWNHPSGTTTKILSWHELNPVIDRVDERSLSNFAAGLRFIKNTQNLVGKYGMYGFDFTQKQITKTYEKTFTFKKSMFCFNGIIICLGSNIASQDPNHTIATTIFQSSVNQKKIQIILDQKSITNFPYSNTFVSGSYSIIVSGTGYYITSKDPIQLKINNQTTPTEDNKMNKTGSFALAYINHGKKPVSNEYQYVVIPGANSQIMTKFKSQMQNPSTKVYEVLRKDQIGHIVYHLESKIYAYSIFKENKILQDENIVTVDKPCLIMLRKQSNKMQLSLVDPSASSTQNNKISVKLVGNYKLQNSTKQVVAKSNINNTSQFVFSPKYGNPIDIVLTKV